MFSAIDGLSIGFKTVKGRVDPKTRVRELDQVDLWEISIVTFPLLSGARVHAVKQASSPPKLSLARTRGERAWRTLSSEKSRSLKYNADQPRISAGNDGAGRWTDMAIGGGRTKLRLAQIIRVCIVSGASRLTDRFGNRSYRATYECAGGRILTREGTGHQIPGLVLDPQR